MCCNVQRATLCEQEIQPAYRQSVIVAVGDRRRILKDFGIDVIGYFRIFGIRKSRTTISLVTE